MVYRLDQWDTGKIGEITEQSHNSSCIILELTNSNDYRTLCNSMDGIYTIKISRNNHFEWELSICDCIDFWSHKNKDIILIMSEYELSHANSRYYDHCCNDHFLRPAEPNVLVHSTPYDNWKEIQRSGMLKSWNKLKQDGLCSEKAPVGSLLGDPKEFSDYIMFGSGVTGEIVVISKQRNDIVMDIDKEYMAGARLYFDAQRIARDGLLLRDGCHLKVENTLPLSPYLLFAATWESIGLDKPISPPRTFYQAADAAFRKLYPDKQVHSF